MFRKIKILAVECDVVGDIIDVLLEATDDGIYSTLLKMVCENLHVVYREIEEDHP